MRSRDPLQPTKLTSFDKICVNFPENTQTVIPSEVEGSRDTALWSFHGIPRLRFASLGMTATFGNIALKSMALQESVHLFGQLSANPFSRSNLLNTCFPETIH